MKTKDKSLVENRFLRNIAALLGRASRDGMPQGGPQEGKTGRSVPPFGGSRGCSDISLFQKIAKLSLEAAILE